MQVNLYPVNDWAINSDDWYEGTILTIQKNINERVIDGGTLVAIGKNIVEIAGGNLLLIEKNIAAEEAPPTPSPTVAPSFYQRFGWEPIVTLGGLTVSASQLHEAIIVTKNEDDNHTAQFTLRLPPNTYNLYNYQGKAVTIRIRKGGTITTLFTGTVDVPEVNALYEKIVIRCVADRKKLLNTTGAYLANSIGFYDKDIMGEATDSYEMITKRLETIPYSIDFNSVNTPVLVSWTPKATADFLFGSNAVYRRDPTLTIESGLKITNQIKISMEFGYQRMHHRQASFIWSSGYSDAAICPFLEDGPTMPNREAVRGAASGSGWDIIDDTMVFQDLPKSGNYFCDNNWVMWSTIQTQVVNLNVVATDANGVTSNVLDSNGNPIVRQSTKQIADYAKIFATAAGWDGYLRFNQNIKEQYTITVQAPDSVNRYGANPSSESYGITSTNQYSEWESTKTYQRPTGVTLNFALDGKSYFVQGDAGDRGRYNNAVALVLNKAKTTILKGHRDTLINFQTDIKPGIELYHTVRLTGKWIRAKGKCKTITHVMNISDSNSGIGGSNYTEITAAQYRGQQQVAETPLVASPQATVVVPPPHEPFINIGSRYGVDPSLPEAASWDGYVGNKSIREQVPNVLGPGYPSAVNITRSKYQESFTVSSKDVSPDLRDEKVFNGAATYNVNIPNDDTVYQSYGGRLG